MGLCISTHQTNQQQHALKAVLTPQKKSSLDASDEKNSLLKNQIDESSRYKDISRYLKTQNKQILNCFEYKFGYNDSEFLHYSIHYIKSYFTHPVEDRKKSHEKFDSDLIHINEWMICSGSHPWYRKEFTLYPSKFVQTFLKQSLYIQNDPQVKSNFLSHHIKYNISLEIRTELYPWILNIMLQTPSSHCYVAAFIYRSFFFLYLFEYYTAWLIKPFESLSWNNQMRRLRAASWYTERYMVDITKESDTATPRPQTYVETNEYLSIPVEQGGLDGACFLTPELTGIIAADTSIDSSTKFVNLISLNEVQFLCDGAIWKQTLTIGSNWRRPTTSCVADIEFVLFLNSNKNVDINEESNWLSCKISLRSYNYFFMGLAKSEEGLQIIESIQKLLQLQQPYFSEFYSILVSKCKAEVQIAHIICGILLTVMRIGARTMAQDEVALFSIPCIDQYLSWICGSEKLLLFMRMKNWVPVIPLYSTKTETTPSAFIKLHPLQPELAMLCKDECILNIKPYSNLKSIQAMKLRCNAATLPQLPKILSDAIKLLSYGCSGDLYLLPIASVNIQKSIDKFAPDDVMQFLEESKGEFLKLELTYPNNKSHVLPNDLFFPYYDVLKQSLLTKEKLLLFAQGLLDKAGTLTDFQIPLNEIINYKDALKETLRDRMLESEDLFLLSDLVNARNNYINIKTANPPGPSKFIVQSHPFESMKTGENIHIISPDFFKLQYPKTKNTEEDSSVRNVADDICTERLPTNIKLDFFERYNNNTYHTENNTYSPKDYNYIFNNTLIAESAFILDNILSTLSESSIQYILKEPNVLTYIDSSMPSTDYICFRKCHDSFASMLKNYIKFSTSLMETNFCGYTLPIVGAFQWGLNDLFLFPASSVQNNYAIMYESWCISNEHLFNSDCELSNSSSGSRFSLLQKTFITSYMSRLYFYENAHNARLSRFFVLGNEIQNQFKVTHASPQQMILFTLQLTDSALQPSDNPIRLQLLHKSEKNNKFTVILPFPTSGYQIRNAAKLNWLLFNEINFTNLKYSFDLKLNSAGLTHHTKDANENSKVSCRVMLVSARKSMKIVNVQLNISNELTEIVDCVHKQLEKMINNSCQLLLNSVPNVVRSDLPEYVHKFSKDLFCLVYTSQIYSYMVVILPHEVVRCYFILDLEQPRKIVEIIRYNLLCSKPEFSQQLKSFEYADINANINSFLHILFQELVYKLPSGHDVYSYLIRPWSLSQINLMIKLLSQRYHVPRSTLLWCIYLKLSNTSIHTIFEQRVFQCVALVLLCKALKKAFKFVEKYYNHLNRDSCFELLEALLTNVSEDVHVTEILQITKLFLVFSMTCISKFSITLKRDLFETVRTIPVECFEKYVFAAISKNSASLLSEKCKLNTLSSCKFGKSDLLHTLSVWKHGSFRTSLYQKASLVNQINLTKASLLNTLELYQGGFNLKDFMNDYLLKVSPQARAFTFVQNQFFYLFYIWNTYCKPHLLLHADFSIRNLYELLNISFQCLWFFDAWVGFQVCEKPMDQAEAEISLTMSDSKLVPAGNLVSCDSLLFPKTNQSSGLLEKKSKVLELYESNTSISSPMRVKKEPIYILDKEHPSMQSFDTSRHSTEHSMNTKQRMKEWSYLKSKINQILDVCNSLIKSRKKNIDIANYPHFLIMYYIVRGLFELSYQQDLQEFCFNFKSALNICIKYTDVNSDFFYCFNSIFFPSTKSWNHEKTEGADPIILFVCSMLAKAGYLQKDVNLIQTASQLFRKTITCTPVCPFDIAPPQMYPDVLSSKYNTIYSYVECPELVPVDLDLFEFDKLTTNIIPQFKKAINDFSEKQLIDIMQWYITSARYDGAFWFESINFPYNFTLTKQRFSSNVSKMNRDRSIICRAEKSFRSLNNLDFKSSSCDSVVLSIGSNAPYGSLGIGWPCYLKYSEQLYSIMPEYIEKNRETVSSGIDIWWTNQFVEVVSLRSKNVKLIAVGEYHSVVVTDENEVYAWGCNTYGQCGVPNVEANAELTPSSAVKGHRFSVKKQNREDNILDKNKLSGYDPSVKRESKNLSQYSDYPNYTYRYSDYACKTGSNFQPSVSAPKYGSLYQSSNSFQASKMDSINQSHQVKWQAHTKVFNELAPSDKFCYIPMVIDADTEKTNNNFDSSLFSDVQTCQKSESKPSSLCPMIPFCSDCVVIPCKVNNTCKFNEMSSSYNPTLALTNIQISNIVCGANFSVLLTADGTVYTWGSNLDGCLGLGSDIKSSWQPNCITNTIINDCLFKEHSEIFARFKYSESFVSEPLSSFDTSSRKIPSCLYKYIYKRINSIRTIACGPLHVCVLDYYGGLWVWGRGDGGQLGLPYASITNKDDSNLNVGTTYPIRLRLFVKALQPVSKSQNLIKLCRESLREFFTEFKLPMNKKKVFDFITCRLSNDNHTLVITTSDLLFLKYSALAVSQIFETFEFHPSEIIFEKVKCGEAHTLAIGKPAGALQFQMLFTWGQCLYGQLGIKSVASKFQGYLEDSNLEKSKPQFTCNAFDLYSLFYSESDDVYLKSAYEQDCRTTPCLILNSYIDSRDNIVVIEAGGCSNFMIFRSGKACVWGSNDFQILGYPDAKLKELQKPSLMSIYPKKKFTNGFFAMGASRLFLITTESELCCIGKDSFGASGHYTEKPPPRVFQEYQSEAQTKPISDFWRPIELPQNFELKSVASGASHTIILGNYVKSPSKMPSSR